MTLPDVAALGITYRQLDHWTTRGYLHPTRDSPRKNRTWPPAELAVAERMGRLTRAGLTVDAAHKVARGATDLGHGVRVTISPTITRKRRLPTMDELMGTQTGGTDAW